MALRTFAIVVVVILGACAPGPGPSVGTAEIQGHAVAGPTCPVEPASPLPGQCAPRPVAGAVLVVADAQGHEVARVTTAADGGFTIRLAVGSYTITPQPVDGLMGIAPPVEVVVPATGTPGSGPLMIEYDTGIR